MLVPFHLPSHTHICNMQPTGYFATRLFNHNLEIEIEIETTIIKARLTALAGSLSPAPSLTPALSISAPRVAPPQSPNHSRNKKYPQLELSTRRMTNVLR